MKQHVDRMDDDELVISLGIAADRLQELAREPGVIVGNADGPKQWQAVDIYTDDAGNIVAVSLPWSADHLFLKHVNAAARLVPEPYTCGFTKAQAGWQYEVRTTQAQRLDQPPAFRIFFLA